MEGQGSEQPRLLEPRGWAVVGAVIIGIPLWIFLAKFVGLDRSFFVITVIIAFGSVIYAICINIKGISYLAILTVSFTAEISAALLLKLPAVPKPAIGILPFAYLNMFALLGILKGVRVLFRLPKWRE